MADPVSKTKGASPPAVPDAVTGMLPPEHWAQLTQELGPDADDDADSTVGDTMSSTASISSSILRYRTINGRRYHSERGRAEYWAPNDDRSQEAMDMNHHVVTLLMGDKIYLAPLPDDIQTAVDIGTGTGIWAIELADEFPNASVIGTDLSPIQPSWVPPNLQFQVDDCTQDWTFQENTLDYVHARWMVGSIADWPALFKQAFKALKPGGYVESHEPASRWETEQGDGKVPEDSALSQWGKFFVEGGKKIGRPFTVLEDEIQRKAMEEAGFVDIQERVLNNPIGKWPRDEKLKEIGAYTQLVFEEDPEGAILFMATTLGWTKEEVAVYITHFRREIRAKDSQLFYRQRIVWGRKPEA